MLRQRIGVMAWWAVLPGLIVYLYNRPRTRLWLESEGTVAVVKGWLGNGKWTLPGGGLHRGEAPVTGLLREVWEETGLQLDGEQVRPAFQERYAARGIVFPCHYFAAELPARPALKPRQLEIIEVAWIDPAELTVRTANPDVLAAKARLWKP